MMRLEYHEPDLVRWIADGKITKAECDRFYPELEQFIEQKGTVRCLAELERFEGWEPAALWKELEFDAKHRNDFSKVALVGAKERWEQWSAKLADLLTSAEIRTFDEGATEEALTWLLDRGTSVRDAAGDGERRVRDLIPPRLETIRSDRSVQSAAKRMQATGVGALPVVDSQLCGIVTDRDITVRATAEGMSPLDTTVAEVMTTTPVCVLLDDTVDRAIEKMRSHGVRRVVVCDAQGKPAGVLSQADLAGSRFAAAATR